MWNKSESAERPATIETIGKFTYVRRHIVAEQRESEQGTMTMYVYEERVFTSDEYASFAQTEQNKANIDYIAMMSDIDIPTEV